MSEKLDQISITDSVQMAQVMAEKPRRRWLLRPWRPLPRAFLPTTRNKKTFLSMPVEIHERIFSFLPLVGQACFALSCRPLYQTFGSVLQNDELRFPRLLWTKVEDRCQNQAYLPRNKLLVRLETKYWRFCGSCLKLHPRTDFMCWRSDTRTPLERQCIYGAGIVDICPCVAITVCEHLRLVEHLMGAAGSKRSILVDRGIFTPEVSENGERRLVHECPVWSNDEYFIFTKLALSPGSNQLLARTNYEIPSTTQPRDVNHVAICPHRTLGDYLGDNGPKSGKCGKCPSLVDRLFDRETKQSLGITVNRTLGRYLSKGRDNNFDKMDENWEKQSRSVWYSDNHQVYW